MERKKIRGSKIFGTTIEYSGVINTLRYNRRLLSPYFVTAKPPHFSHPCSVKIEFFVSGLGTEGRFDLDHLVEQILNALTDADLISDDKLVFNIEATMYDAKSSFSEKVVIELYEWET